MTLTSTPLPDPQVLLAAGLSDLAALAAPDGPSQTKPAVPPTTDSRPPLRLGDVSSAGRAEVRDGAATAPPPRVMKEVEADAIGLKENIPTARARPSLGVDATPTHDAADRKRPAATPPTDVSAVAPPPRENAAFDARAGAGAGDAATLATSVESTGVDDARRRAAHPVGVAADDVVAAKEAASMPARAGSETARAEASANGCSLVSPATAAAAALLAGVGAKAAPPGRSATRAEACGGDDVVLGSEALFSKFAAAAAEPEEPEDPGARPAPLAEPEGPDPAARAGKKRRTLSQAVEQFRLETEKAAAEATTWCGGSGSIRSGDRIDPPDGAFASDAKAPGDGEAAGGAAALFAALAPPPKKRKPRRWLSEDEKVFTCGIDGCVRSYGSASSLCAHKRAHHPGWKERRDRRREAEASARAAAPEEEEEEEEEDKEEDENDVAGRQARKEGSKALDASARLTPSGAWIESLAADAHARLGALRRSRQRVQRGVRDARAATRALTQPPPFPTSEAVGGAPRHSASSVAAAAATRLLQSMETALEAEADNLHAWLERLERVAELRQNAGRALFPEEPEEAARARFAGGFASPVPMGPAEARAAAQTARETASALAGAAAAFGHGGKRKERAAKPADRGR